MTQTLTYKILQKHLVEGELKAGQPIGIRIDQTLTQDATEPPHFCCLNRWVPPGYRRRYLSAMSITTWPNSDRKTTMTIFICRASRPKAAFISPVPAMASAIRCTWSVCRPGATLLGSDSHTPLRRYRKLGHWRRRNGRGGGDGRRAVLPDLPEGHRR